MSAEYEANRNVAPRNDMQKSLKNESSNDDDDTLEDLAGSANNSLIGKVKSRVSSIIPSSFSKWFSPSTPYNVKSFSAGTARRRRRRLEIGDDEYIDDTNESNEDAVLAHSEYKANLPSRSGNIKDSDEDDTDNNSEEELTNEAGVHSQRAHYTMKTYGTVSQPPSKRPRISFDTTNIHQPLVASTPAIGDSHRNVHINSPSLEDRSFRSTGSHSIRHYTETPAYNQRELEHQTSFTFPPTTAKDVKIQENIASKLNSNEKIFENISSRRTLHLPSTSQVANERSMGYPSHKRQSLSGIRDVNKHTGETPLMNTSTTIIVDEDEAQSSRNEQSDFKTNRNLNGSTLVVGNSKKQRLNGTDEAEESNADSASECSEGCVGNISELPNNALSLRQRKTGLFNMSNLNSQNGKSSRTSSFGNGINFYSHLEGRKSLFSGGTHTGDPSNTLNNSTLSLTSLNRRQFNASIYGSTSALSDSRLLNTFSPFYKGKTTYGGAAAYKKYSTGASRVCTITPTIIRPTSSLSTLSSSNNSLAATTGPTNNALSGLGSNSVAENTSAISSTAKRILDLINDFATPLSEAKKMANSNVVKAYPQTLPQAKTRLNETDLQTSRAIRLSQVRTPYARPAVTLQPISRNASAFPPPVRELQVPSMSQLLQMKKMQSTTERSRQIAMQNSSSTTRSNVGSGAYKLPLATEGSVVDKEYVPAHQQQQQQQHTNKIKSKVRTSARITATKNVTNLEDDELPPTINLPNIAFPQMQSVPTFGIAVSKPQNITTAASSGKTDLAKFDSFTKAADAVKVSSANSGGATINNSIFTNKTKTNFGIGNSNNDTIEQNKNSENVNSNNKDKASAVFTETKMNFKFSNPLVIAEVAAADISAQKIVKKYTFSPPATVIFGASSIETTSAIQNKIPSSESPSVPQLKSGSVLDALKKTFNSATATKDNKVISTGDAELKVGFGDQFKKSAENKWECETCLIRNDSNLNKCVACETPRVTLTPINQQTTPKDTLLAPLNAGTSTFGGQFKKPTDQWECEVCMIRNKEQDNNCVACETPRKVASASSTKLSASLDNASSSWKPNTFGDTFKPKPNTWECPTCLINNKSDSNECVACQTKNPSNSVSDTITQNKAPTTFKFGFSASTNNTTTSTQSTTAASADTGFKTIAAAQMSAKWECDACMTRNDAVRSKCVCCEQAKPGATTPDVPSNGPKFTFGSTASTKYTFGFSGANANEAPTAVSNNPATSAAISNEKTDGGSAKGFIFGNKSSTTTSLPSAGGMGFSFGIKPASSTAENATSKKSSESNDITDKGSGSSTAAISEEKASGFKFGVPSSTGTSSTTTTATSPAVKFSLAMPVTTAEPVKSDATVTATVKTTTAGFTFGSSSITNAASQSATSGFSFGAPAKTISGETSTATTGSAKTTASFSFGTTTVSTQANQTAATSSTATVKPMFSFGNNTTPPKTTSASTSASASTTISSSNAAPLTNPTGGFSFGSTSTPGTGTSSSTAKSLFGSFVSPTTTISVTTSAITSVPATTMPKLSAAPTTNVFGTFGEHASSAKTTTTTSAAATTLPSTTSTNIFGVTSASGDSKPTAPATMLFGSANNATTTNKATGTPFVFGSSSSTTTPQSSNAAASGGMVATGTSWPKGGFAFGGSTANSGTSNTNDSSKPVFGSFMNAAAPVAAASTTIPAMGAGNPVFGSISASSTTSGTTATFGSVAANASTPSPAAIFGTGGGSTAPTQPTPNLFGSSATTTSAFGAAPSFGSGNNNMGNNASTFGVASPTQFGSFGSTTSSRTSAADGASAPKKSEPAFNFGGNTSQVGSSGGFNFGAQASTAAKPAFNFSASNVPTFNFTGSSGDATPNAPFQFNAGSAPASSNIFAPTPAAPNAAGGPMQARRKIRQPTRRLTPR